MRRFLLLCRYLGEFCFFFFSSRRRHTRCSRDWSSDVCSSDLRFEDVMLTNAPDVHVYLSPESGGRWDERTSLYLGALKATNGSFNYELPALADVGSYKSVVVWCRAFRV